MISCVITVSRRKPLAEKNAPSEVLKKGEGTRAEVGVVRDDHKLCPKVNLSMVEPLDWHLNTLISQISSVLNSNPLLKASARHDEAEDPASIPVFWVSKWVDYSDKYGLGYQLCDDSVGVLFNDQTRILLGPDGQSMQYIDKNETEEFHTITNYPEEHNKKVVLLNYFRSYMSEHLLKAGGEMGEREIEDGTRLPHMRHWFRTRSAIVLHLSNGIMQINFFSDHTKVIICPLMQAISYIDESKNFRTFKFSSIEKYGCSKDIHTRLKYAKTMAERLLSKLCPPSKS